MHIFTLEHYPYPSLILAVVRNEGYGNALLMRLWLWQSLQKQKQKALQIKIIRLTRVLGHLQSQFFEVIPPSVAPSPSSRLLSPAILLSLMTSRVLTRRPSEACTFTSLETTRTVVRVPVLTVRLLDFYISVKHLLYIYISYTSPFISPVLSFPPFSLPSFYSNRTFI